jgi:predicted metal-dependent RNase
MNKLSRDEEDEVLRKLVQIRNNPEELSKYNTPEMIWREVVASSKLADIDFTEEEWEELRKRIQN